MSLHYRFSFVQVLDANPVHVKALYRRGMAYMEVGEFEEARSDFNKVILSYVRLIHHKTEIKCLMELCFNHYTRFLKIDDDHRQIIRSQCKGSSS